MDIEEYQALVLQIYETSLNPSAWSDLLKTLASMLGASCSIINHEEFSKNGSGIFADSSVEPEFIKKYVQHFGSKNPWIHDSPKSLLKPGFVATGDMLLSPWLLQKTEFYNEFLKPFDIGQTLGGVIQSTSRSVTNISFQRSDQGPRFEEKEIKSLTFLMPHLCQAFKTYSRLSSVIQFQKISFIALEKFHSGIILLNSDLEIYFANKFARDCISKKNGLEIQKKKLVFPNRNKMKEFINLLNAVKNSSLDPSIRPGGSFLVQRSNSIHPYHIHIYPIPYFFFQNGSMKNFHVIIFIETVESFAKENETRSQLSKVFCFTKRESELATYLLFGLSLEDSGKKMGISFNTARTHLRHIMEKTYSTRQGELISKLTKYLITTGW